MRKISMKKKLVFLCVFFCSMMLLSSLFLNFTIFNLKTSVHKITDTDIPLIENIDKVIIHAERIHGFVYKSIYVSDQENPQLKKYILENVDELKKDILSELKKIKSHELTSEEEKLEIAVEESVTDFIAISSKIINLTFDGKKSEMMELLIKSDEIYVRMEKDLTSLSKMIEKESSAHSASAVNSADKGSKASLIMLVVILVIGILASYLIVKNLMKNVIMAIENLSASVHEVQNSSQKMNFISRQLSENVDKQASSITESASAMDEIAAMIKNNDHSAKAALALSENAKVSAESGKTTMVKMREEVTTISKSYEDLDRVIKQSIDEIKTIIQIINEIALKTEVINEIVFQTKLLSFNASVEAARAGEAGKGFAVVAEEVGNLAQMSGSASSEISTLLKTSQERVVSISENITKNVSSIVLNGQNKVLSGEKISIECLEELNIILGIVVALDKSIYEITTALNEQSTGVEEVNQALRHLDQATLECTSMSNKSKETSDDLTKSSHSLRSTIQELRKDMGASKNYDVPPLENFNS